MAEIVPPLPHKSPMLTKAGHLTEPWAKWFRQMFNRIGGVSALSNTELETLQSQDLSGVEADIEALEESVAALETNLQDQLDMVLKGPTL